jgi:pantoate--beta-alanine ligase
MRVTGSIPELRTLIADWRRHRQRVALVPTMGNLHAGHLGLVEKAREISDRVVVSIFVNPLQFGPAEDFDTYPRTLEADTAVLRKQGTDLLFVPVPATIYPLDPRRTTRVEVPDISEILCGEFRPGFFVGVATVVAKLFNLVQPDVAVFGEKDFQQLVIIRRMVTELNWPIEVVGVPTVREADGLALSSRNAYLRPEERAVAPRLYAILCDLAERLRGQSVEFQPLEADAMRRLAAAGFRPDYVSVRRRADLARPDARDRKLVVLAAAWLGDRARLIDNISMEFI